MRVFDCCLLFQELDLLEIRLHTHTWADVHVIVESTRTFSNLPKPVALDVKDKRFAPFAHKIRHVVMDDLKWPAVRGKALGKQARMALNGEQWDRAKTVLTDAEPGDMIVLSDMDEIVKPESIEWAKARVANGPVRFNLKLYTYALNGVRAPQWFGPVAGLAKDVLGGSLWKYRQDHRNTAPLSIYGAGWHFSSLGDVDTVHAKLEGAAHTEWDRLVGDKAALKKWMAEGRVFSPSNGNAGVVQYVPIDDTFPPYLVANQERFSRLIHK